MRRGLKLFWFVLALGAAGCREGDLPVDPDGSESPNAQDGATQLSDLALPPTGELGAADLRPSPDLASVIPNPPARPNTDSYCLNRWRNNPDSTGIQAVVRVDEYRGVKTGRNGPHEFIHGTLVRTVWLLEMGTIDTTNVELSMNVQTMTDMHGLPMEVPVAAGDYVEVEGEYIPMAKASASTAKGPAAVIHFTHSPCGYAVLNGKTFP